MLVHRGNCPILPGKLSGQGIDFRLTLCRDRGKVRSIALKKSARLRRLTATVSRSPRMESRDHRGHPARDLPLDQVELTLCLPACFLHTGKLRLSGPGGES